MKTKKEKPWIWIIWGIIAGIVICIIGYAVYKSISFNYDKWGTIGDAFGGLITPLITGITIIYLIKTYISQKKANDILREQENSKLILSQIDVLKPLNLRESCDKMVELFEQEKLTGTEEDYSVFHKYYNEIIYVLEEIDYTYNIISEYNGSFKDSFVRKLKMVYDNRFADSVNFVICKIPVNHYLKMNKEEVLLDNIVTMDCMKIHEMTNKVHEEDIVLYQYVGALEREIKVMKTKTQLEQEMNLLTHNIRGKYISEKARINKMYKDKEANEKASFDAKERIRKELEEALTYIANQWDIKKERKELLSKIPGFIAKFNDSEL
jgi:uncharacterized membrane protein